MRKLTSLIVMMTMLSVVVASSPLKHARDHNTAKCTVYKPVAPSAVDQLFVNDFSVPVVQMNPSVHAEAINDVLAGHAPAKTAMVRGPTATKPYLPRSRDKPRLS
jgi:hypothetical protein